MEVNVELVESQRPSLQKNAGSRMPFELAQKYRSFRPYLLHWNFHIV